MAIVHILCTHSDYPTRIGTVIALQLSHRDCHIANVALKPSHHDCHIATDVSHCTSRLSLNALHIAMLTSISSHSRPYSSICTSLSSNLHHRLARPPGPPYTCFTLYICTVHSSYSTLYCGLETTAFECYILQAQDIQNML